MARNLGPTVAVALAIAAAVVVAVGMAAGGDAAGAGGSGDDQQVLSPAELASEMADGRLDTERPTLTDRLDTDVQAPLPTVALDGFDGGPARSTDDYRGTPLLVNFWASWCAPCVEEMPDLDDLAQRTEGELAMLGVNRADAEEPAAALVDDLGIDYDLARDPDDELFPAVSGFGMPTTLFVDADGVIVHRRTGALSADELADLVSEHLGVEAG